MPTEHRTTQRAPSDQGRRRRRAARATTLVLVVGLLLAACSSSGDDEGATATTSTAGEKVPLTGVPGVSDDEIRFSAVGTNSGNPLGTCVLDCFLDGVNAYFDYRNSEGGVWGRDLVVTTVLDDELSKNQEQSLAIISADDTFATFSAPFVPSGWADLADAGIPTYTLAINPPQAAGHPEIFGNNPVFCIDCTSRTAPYVVQLAGASKVASLGYGVSENSKVCAEANVASIEDYGADIGGATVVYANDNLAFGLPNGIGPEVTAMKEAGVDFVLSCLDLNGMKTLASELERQGIRDQVTLLHANSYDQDYMAESGAVFEGDYVQVSFRPFEADAGSSQLSTYEEWMAKAGTPLSEHSMMGWINADLAYQGLEAAGPDFSRQKVIDATNTLTSFTAGGLVVPIDWTRQHDAPTQDDVVTHGPAQECLALVRVQDGAFEVAGDPARPWECWPGDTRDWSEPVATDFQ